MATTVDAKLLRATKFPPEFNQKVDMQKVNLDLMKKWIAGKISELLGSDDDVVIELCFGLIEGSRFPDIKKLQIQLTGFLDKDTPSFCKELWNLCLSAQTSPQGVPKELLEAKKLELIQEKLEQEKSAEEARKRHESEQHRERDINNIRERERNERGRGGGRGGGESWRGGRGRDDRNRGLDRNGGRGFERRPQRSSRSPPPRRDSRDRDSYRAPRNYESYVPAGRDDRRQHERSRGRLSVSQTPSEGRSNSETPPRRRRRLSTRSPSPPRRRAASPVRRADTYRGRGRARSPERRTRRRSPSFSDGSISRSPPPTRRRASPSISSSVSPAVRSRKSRKRSISRSPSRSRSPSPDRKRLSRSPKRDLLDPATRGGRKRNERRLTRSRSRSYSRSTTPPRRRRRSPSRSRSRDREPGRDRKRRRRDSEEDRRKPQRRRNTSSISSVEDTKDRKADIKEAISKGTPEREPQANAAKETVDPRRQASILKEKLLREQIKKMRTSNNDTVKIDD